MIPTDFPEANSLFKAPPDFDENQVRSIRAFCGEAKGGSVDGVRFVVVAWKPTEQELAALNSGKPVFLSVMGGLPPHFLCTDFSAASNPA